MILVVLLALPLAAVVLSLLPVARWFAPAVSIAATLGSAIGALVVALRVAAGVRVVAVPGWIAADGLSALMLLLVAYVGFMAALFSWGYMRRENHGGSRSQRAYYVNFNAFIFALLAVPAVVEPALAWIAVELTTLFSILLVSFDNSHEALEAAWKYAVLTIMGGMMALLGFLMLFWALETGGGGSFTWSGMTAAAPHLPPMILGLALVFILVGFGTKVGFVPLHTWLPDAHSQAPAPVCAILSGVKTATALYVILRLVPILRTSFTVDIGRWLVVIGLISVGVAAFLLMQVRDYKRMFAFSTVEHMGIILVAAGLTDAAGPYGAAYQILTHGITKSFCFFAAGAVLLLAGTRDIGSVRGLLRRSPFAAVVLLIAGLAIAGAPPFPIFLSELSILRAGLAGGQTLVVTLLAIFIVVAFVGVMLQINRMVFGEGSAPRGASSLAPRGALPRTCIATLLLGAAPIVVLGIYTPATVHDLLRLSAMVLGR